MSAYNNSWAKGPRYGIYVIFFLKEANKDLEKKLFCFEQDAIKPEGKEAPHVTEGGSGGLRDV